jgi:maltose phosphorylase
MKNYLKKDEWCIIEEGFNPHYNRISESVFSIGNGHQGQRANFEETYTGESLQGSYMAGVYYPDKTRVGWWKNGYPEYFAKVLNATNWIGLEIKIGNELLDLAKCQVRDFKRVLNMREGYLERSFIAKLPSGKELKVQAQRLVSIVQKEIGALKYAITPLNFTEKVDISLYLDGDVKNQDANYGEKFWEEISKQVNTDTAYLTIRTKKTGFYLCSATTFEIFQNGETINVMTTPLQREKYVGHQFPLNLKQNEETIIYKFAANVTSRDHNPHALYPAAQNSLQKAFAKGYDTLKMEQVQAWAKKWEKSDIVIEGDVAAQQGIRFNIFQLDQTYTGEDERLNIGPKGFTGEKYGGSTYWDTEAYCLAFYLATTDTKVARNLLLYRYKQLGKAIENGEKLGYKNGAALFPMVTMNGEECHNEWEITFEEIHRNGAIARAVYDYVNYTNDRNYLIDYGLELLIAIARFWTQRVNFSSVKQKYVILGVTGPNEYENNINNNWYTNLMACWCLEYTTEVIGFVKAQNLEKYEALVNKIHFEEAKETAKWQDISQNMFFPEDKNLGVFLQQEGYLDKEQITVDQLPKEDRPINQKWSWDRILRSCFIKQADTLQGIYVFEDQYDIETIRRNFDFYEPRTVHESSLSPCVHAILAAKLSKKEKAYEMYLRTSRLDLDDYNNDTEDGLHITSMAGTWMSVVQGFGGMRVREGKLVFNPMIPPTWKAYSFKINFRGCLLRVKVRQEEVSIDNLSSGTANLEVYNQAYTIAGYDKITLSLAMADVMN